MRPTQISISGGSSIASPAEQHVATVSSGCPIWRISRADPLPQSMWQAVLSILFVSTRYCNLIKFYWRYSDVYHNAVMLSITYCFILKSPSLNEKAAKLWLLQANAKRMFDLDSSIRFPIARLLICQGCQFVFICNCESRTCILIRSLAWSVCCKTIKTHKPGLMSAEMSLSLRGTEP